MTVLWQTFSGSNRYVQFSVRLHCRYKVCITSAGVEYSPISKREEEEEAPAGSFFFWSRPRSPYFFFFFFFPLLFYIYSSFLFFRKKKSSLSFFFFFSLSFRLVPKRSISFSLKKICRKLFIFIFSTIFSLFSAHVRRIHFVFLNENRRDLQHISLPLNFPIVNEKNFAVWLC